MQALLRLEFNIFLMIAVGCFIRKQQIIGDAGEAAITGLVMSVILPCNVFCSFLTQNMETLAADCLWILAISIGVQLVAFLYTRIVFRMSNDAQRCNLSYAMISPNTGFIGRSFRPLRLDAGLHPSYPAAPDDVVGRPFHVYRDQR